MYVDKNYHEMYQCHKSNDSANITDLVQRNGSFPYLLKTLQATTSKFLIEITVREISPNIVELSSQKTSLSRVAVWEGAVLWILGSGPLASHSNKF